MKKIYFIILLLIIPIVSSAQIVLDSIPLKDEMSYVFYADNTIEDKITNAKTWIATAFGDYKSVLQFEDNQSGRIVIKGHIPASEIKTEWVAIRSEYLFTMIFDIKEDRYRIKFEDIISKRSIFYENNTTYIKQTIDKYLNDVCLSDIDKEELGITDCEKRLKKTQSYIDFYKNKKAESKYREQYTKLTLELKELEAKGETRILKYKQERADEYKNTFFNILKSASDKISESDIF